jgi:glycosyltransferase involved in cell wall biosynthesis
MKLCIVIPALNEEGSIEKIILRTSEAKQFIIENSEVQEVEITVVSDGSDDDTVSLAKQHLDKVHFIEFQKNKGYGAAIKQGWIESDADLLGFLDADGTCDPVFFADLCRLISETNCDVALGCRLNKDSQMPFIRRLGNMMFSLLLTYLASEKVKDTASGMRVVRRTSLPELLPLPDGLHFTPAMSARSLLSDKIRICEKEMVYKERDGESKLSVWKDGFRFLRVILETAILYRPNRLLNLIGVCLSITALVLVALPVSNYLSTNRIEDWMIYRLTVVNFLGISAALFFSASFLTEKIVSITISRPAINIENGSLTGRIYSSRLIWFLPFLAIIIGFSLISNSLLERITLGTTNEHWSRYIAMSFFMSIAIIIFVTKSIDHVLTLLSSRIDYLQSEGTSIFRT